MGLRTRPLSDHVGVEVIGVNADGPIADDVRRDLYDIFVESGVLLFRGIAQSPDSLLNLSRCFGEPGRHPVREVWVEGYPEIIDLSYRPRTDGTSAQPVYQVNGQPRAGWQPWHCDLCYMDTINRGGILRAIEVPSEGGKTGFIDKIRSYDTLPDRLKRRIEGLSVIYRFQPDFARQKYGEPRDVTLLSSSGPLDSLMARLERDFPPVLHPMVYTQPETGRKVLNVSPAHAIHIQGMENEAGDALLGEVVAHCADGARAYHHDWQGGDMVLFDNWRTLHCAEGVPLHCTRIIQRTTIDGDYALGKRLIQ